MQTISEIRSLLAARGITPKHKLGQNFLHDKNQLQKLIDSANVQPGEVVLEVGPGTGTLTEALLDAGATVVACEIDRDMVDILTERLGEKITLIQGDCLESGRQLNASVRTALDKRSFKLIANLPYQIASPLMARLLISHRECAGQWVTIQREVADRLLAPPGTKTYGPLSIIVQALAAVRKLAVLKPNSFWPTPKVTSSMVEILPFDDRALDIDDAQAFAQFVTQLFTKRRKQLGTIFGRDRDEMTWPEGICASDRPDALDVRSIVALWRAAGNHLP